MKYVFTAVLSLSCLFLLNMCSSIEEQSRDLLLSSKLQKFELLGNDFTVDRKTRDKNQMDYGKELTRDFPAALPIGRDSAERIFKAKLPPQIGDFRFKSKETYYEKPQDKPDKDSVFFYPNQLYVRHLLTYVKPKRKSEPAEGCFLAIADQGNMVEWANAISSIEMLKGDESRIFKNFISQSTFDKTVDYQGRRWAVWKSNLPVDHSVGQRKPSAYTTYFTMWNNRFPIIIMTSDAKQTPPDFFEQVVNVEWLNQLKYPSR